MKYAIMFQLSNMLIFWGMLALAFYAANGSASRAGIASYTESTAYLVQLLVVAALSPLMQFAFGPSVDTMAATMSAGIAAPSLAALYALFSLVTIIASAGLLAFTGGITLRNLVADLTTPLFVEESDEPQVKTAE